MEVNTVIESSEIFIISIELLFSWKFMQFNEICSIQQDIKRQYTESWPPSVFLCISIEPFIMIIWIRFYYYCIEYFPFITIGGVFVWFVFWFHSFTIFAKYVENRDKVCSHWCIKSTQRKTESNLMSTSSWIV